MQAIEIGARKGVRPTMDAKGLMRTTMMGG